jgi:hypothetical protein
MHGDQRKHLPVELLRNQKRKEGAMTNRMAGTTANTKTTA